MVGTTVLRDPYPDKQGRVEADDDDDESGNNPGVPPSFTPYRNEGVDGDCLCESGVRWSVLISSRPGWRRRTRVICAEPVSPTCWIAPSYVLAVRKAWQRHMGRSVVVPVASQYVPA